VTSENVKIIDIGINMHYVNKLDPKWYSIFLWLLKLVIIEFKQAIEIYKHRDEFEILICTLGNYYLLAILIACMFRKKVITASYGDTVQRVEMNYRNVFFTLITRLLVNIIFRLSNCIIIESPCIGENDLVLAPYKHKLVNGSLYIDKFDDMGVITPLCKRDSIIGFIGRLVPEKGIVEFIQAIPLMLENSSEIKVLIIGSGILDNFLKDSLEKNTWSSQVEWHKWVDHSNIPSYLNKLKLLVMPSYIEGLPNLLLESMMCGTPVLASTAGGISDLIVDRKTGFLLKKVSPQVIAFSVKHALSSNQLHNIANNAKRLVEKEYSVRASIERFSQIIDFCGK